MSSPLQKWWWVILLLILVALSFVKLPPPPMIQMQHLPGVWWLPDEYVDTYWTFDTHGSFEILLYSRSTLGRWMLGAPTIKGRWLVVGDQLQLIPTEVPIFFGWDDDPLTKPQSYLILRLSQDTLQLEGWGAMQRVEAPPEH